MNDAYKYSELTSTIIGIAMEVHRELGIGFQELIYHRALALELKNRGLDFRDEHEMDVYYKGQWIGRRRVDFLVEDLIVVEIKAVGELEAVHLVQGLNYLDILNLEIGLLINFGSRSMQFKRLINSKYKRKLP